MRTVWWHPEGSNDSILTAVQINPVRVTEPQWLEALADRVQALVNQCDNPQDALASAVRILGREGVMLPIGPESQAGQILVLNNSRLKAEMERLNPRFPMLAIANVEEPEMMDDLALWVEAAAAALRT